MKTLINKLTACATLSAVVTLLSAPSTRAGGPLYVCDSGQPMVWPGGGAAIPFNPDQGTLGPLSHAEAVAAVQAAFDVWDGIPSATVSYVNAGELPVDVDFSNFIDYVFPPAPDGLSAIVFDTDGQIFDLLFGPGSGILGFAGPEWYYPATCEVAEGVAFLNGPAFADAVAALDVMVHEFGHYSGLAHSVVNGQIFLGDNSGPTPHDTFGAPAITEVETMYPYYFGPGTEMSTPEADDVASISTLYPAGDFAANSGAIQGTIFAANGTTPLTGVNVIARNLANPFKDAVSAFSGDYSLYWNPGDPLAGVYTLRGLTPGAQYAVYIDQILAGGFSTPPIFPFPGSEEFYNGLNESNNLGTTSDNPADYTPVTAAAGSTTSGIKVVFNGFRPGDPLPVGDDSFVELPLPFPFRIGGQTFNSVFVNANGNLTFGGPDSWFGEDIPGFLAGLPRIAGLWDDLNPSQGGSVSYQQTAATFTILWSRVPEFFNEGEVSFEIVLHKDSSNIDIRYGTITATDGLAGITCGSAITTGYETPTDLTAFGSRRINLQSQPAMFELFDPSRPNDLAGKTLRFNGTSTYNDEWAGSNNTIAKARRITLPFDSKPITRHTEIEPAGADVDYFVFSLKKGDVLLAQVTAGYLDSLLGLFRIVGTGSSQQGVLVAYDDDSGPGVLSFLAYQVLESGDYALAATTFPDFEFNGSGFGGGRYVLELKTVTPDPNDFVFNGSFEFGLAGWTADFTGAPFVPWMVSPAGDGSGFDMAPTSPQDGVLDLWNGFDGEGPMQFTLYQDVTIPAGGSQATLSWKDRVQWNYLVAIQTQPRTYSVQIRDPVSNAILQTLHTFDTGIADGLGDTGWQSRSSDVSGFIGSTIRIWFEQGIPEAFTGPGQFELDAVRLQNQ